MSIWRILLIVLASGFGLFGIACIVWGLVQWKKQKETWHPKNPK